MVADGWVTRRQHEHIALSLKRENGRNDALEGGFVTIQGNPWTGQLTSYDPALARGIKPLNKLACPVM